VTLNLPTDADLERRLLTVCLIDPDAIHIAGGHVEPDDFSVSANSTVFRSMRRLADCGIPVGPESVIADLQREGGGTEVDLFVAKLVTGNYRRSMLEFYARTIRELAVRRRMIAAAREVAVMASQTGRPIETVLQTAADRYAVAADLKRNDSQSQQDAIRAAWTEWERPWTDGPRGITTGFRDIDRITDGWIAEDLIVIAARTSVGKSTLLLHLAREAARAGEKVLIITMEMTVEAMMRRLVASTAMIPERQNWSVSAGLAAKAAQACAELSDLPISWLTGRMTVGELTKHVRIHQLRQECTILFVDQLGNLLPAKRHQNKYGEVSEVSEGLKALAEACKIPVIAAHQLHRDAAKIGDGERPKLHHLRDSGNIEQDASLVMLLHRTWDDHDRHEGPIEVDVAKSRRGTGSTTLYYIGEQTRFAPAFSPQVVANDG
jgi:replicative DNA helicase